ncbi:hypothetical protein D3C76_989880 [compost metagenome]
MDQRVDGGEFDFSLLAHLLQAIDDRLLGVAVVSQNLGRVQPVCDLHGNVGERATNVDTGANGFSVSCHYWSPGKTTAGLGASVGCEASQVLLQRYNYLSNTPSSDNISTLILI